MWRIKYAVFAALAAFVAAWDPCGAAFVGLADEYEVWLGGSSSARMETLSASEYARRGMRDVGGVSCRVDLSPEEVLELFRARVIRTETAAGTTSYYACSPDLPFGVGLFGETVNLHVAVRDGEVRIGTPVIFGSF